ncbi:hypothetical protein M426DRAFT_21453 [Hypoxylon sp. CI-4A]|nr:hypothetical protein M426DRAFT_21453 [Hypoxylon sp. CI-4A]
MDPATIFQLVGGVISIGDAVIRCTNRLSALKAKYRDASILLSAVIGQLFSVQTAIGQLSQWKTQAHQELRYQQLALQIDNALDAFFPLIHALQDKLDQFGAHQELTPRGKLAFLWNERELNDYLILLDRQVNALNLLLRAIQCKNWPQQQEMMRSEETQTILQLAQDCSSSIIGLNDSSSLISEETNAISTCFEFDTLILGSRLYQQAERSHLRQAIRASRAEHHSNDLNRTQWVTGTDPRTGYRAAASGPPNEVSEYIGVGLAISSEFEHLPPILVLDDSFVQEQDSAQGEESSHHSGSQMSESTSITEKTKSEETQLMRKSKVYVASKVTVEHIYPESGSARMSHGSRNCLAYNSSRKLDINRYPKVLLLGTSRSGKSTLLAKIKHTVQANHFDNSRTFYNEIIWNNVMQCMASLMEHIIECDIRLKNVDNDENVRKILADYDNQGLAWTSCRDAKKAQVIAQAFMSIWMDQSFQEAFAGRKQWIKYNLGENAEYFMLAVQRLAADNWTPTDDDIIRSSVRTISVTENVVRAADFICNFVDIGGTRAMRPKWIKAMEDPSTVIFTIDTTSTLPSPVNYEDTSIIDEQFGLFKSTVNHPSLKKVPFIVIFTKMDLLESALADQPVQRALLDLTGKVMGKEAVNEYMERIDTSRI